MSFLHDKNIYMPIINGELRKYSQNTAPSPDALVIAKKLADKLSRELTNSPEPLNLASATDSALKVDNLQSLGALLKFLANNRMTLNGVRLVYTSDEEESIPSNEESQVYPVTGTIASDRDAATRKLIPAEYSANIKLLISYISYLQQKSGAMIKGGQPEGKVLEVMIGKIIDQLNSIEPTELTRKPPADPTNPSSFEDNTQLDLLDIIFDTKNPYAKGTTALYAKDIKSKNALDAWLEKNKVKTKIYNEEGNSWINYPYGMKQFDACIIINVLFARAQNNINLAHTNEEKRAANFYLKTIKEVGGQFTDASGKACTVGSLSGGTSGGSGAGGANGAGNGQATDQLNKLVPAGMDPQVFKGKLNDVVQKLPLRLNDIDFSRISEFFRAYLSIAGNSGQLSVSVNQLFNQFSTAAIDINEMTISQMISFPLYGDAGVVVKWLKNPQQNYMQFLDAQHKILQVTMQAIQLFYNTYIEPYGDDFDAQQKAMVSSQILGESIFKDNWRKIARLKDQIDQVIKFKK